MQLKLDDMKRIVLSAVLVALFLAGCDSDERYREMDDAYESGYDGADAPGDMNAYERDAHSIGVFDSECDDLKRRGDRAEWDSRGCVE